MIYKLLIIIISVSIFSCKRELKFAYPNTAKVHQQVFGIDETLPMIKIDFSKNRDSALALISKSFNRDICWQKLAFNYPISSYETIKLFIFKKCDYMSHGFSGNFPLRINMNSQGQLLAQNELLLIDEVSSFMEDHLGLNSSPKFIGNEVQVKWLLSAPADSLNFLLKVLKIGYLKVWNNSSHINYKQSFYDISKSERDSVLQEIPFEIYLDIGRFSIPTPPPLITQ